ncbi:hypothetical protein BPUTSESOX_608 [uncultured Gammaproteobacteria bacterium]|nr:hypothetical protein BPUTSESOX_608 [uncultured Gammaproteobacteria bacterium]
MLCTSSSSDRDLCSITRESANEFCWVFFQDILGVLWVLFYQIGGFLVGLCKGLMVSLFVGQLCIFLHVSLLFLVGLRVVNIPFGRLIECCTYDVNSRFFVWGGLLKTIY